MAASATRTITINYTTDVVGSETLAAAINPNSPASVTIHALISGDNTITVPASGGFATVKGATIVPPAGNAQNITLKGAGADTGIALSQVDPTSIGFQTAPATFILNAGGAINGLRIFWS